MSAPDLSTQYLGLSLRTPLVASSCPLTGRLDDLRRLEDAGAAAVVLPSLFEEEIDHESLEIDALLETGAESFGEALDYFPDLGRYERGPERAAELVARAKAALEIPVIASLNGCSPGGWVEHARRLVQAGADALELNLYEVAADPQTRPDLLEGQLCELVRSVRANVQVPLAVKLVPFFTALAHFAARVVDAGANGLVLFNRFYQPDIDLETLEVRPRLALSRSEEARLPIRWIALLHGRLRASLAATTGIHDHQDVLKALLAGADVTFLASALLESGPALLARIERDLSRWMEEREYESVRQLRGSMSQRSCPDPAAFERGNYVATLRSWSSAFRS